MKRKYDRDCEDDNIEPLGPKRPMEFFKPTFKLMAVGTSIETSKFPQVKIHAAAKVAGVRVQITELSDRLKITVVGKRAREAKPAKKQGEYLGAGKIYPKRAFLHSAKAPAEAAKRKKKVKLSPVAYFQNWKQAQKKTDIFS
jgi:hypothetical protein